MFNIKKASIADLKDIQNFLNKSFHDTYDHNMGIDETQKLIELYHKDEVLSEQLKNDNTECLIIKKADINQIDILQNSTTLENKKSEKPSDNLSKSKNNVKDNQIIAHAYAELEKPREVKLYRLYVEKDYHRQGIGRQLLMKILDTYVDCQAINTEVVSNNLKAVVFFKQHGFIDCGKIGQTEGKNSVPILKMMKIL